MNLQPEQDHHHVRTVGGDQFDSFTGDSNGLGGPFGGLVYSIGSSAQLDLGTHSFRGTASTHVQQEQEQEQACCPVVEINSSSSVELVKEEFDEECSRKRSTFLSFDLPVWLSIGISLVTCCMNLIMYEQGTNWTM